MSRKNSVSKRGKNSKLKFDSTSKEVQQLAKQLPKGFAGTKTARLLNAQDQFKKLETRLGKLGAKTDYEKMNLPAIKKMSRTELNRYTRYLEHAVNNPTVRFAKFSVQLNVLEENQREVANINREIQKNYNRRQQMPLLEKGKQRELAGQKLTVDYHRYIKHGLEGSDLNKFVFNPNRFKDIYEYMDYFADLKNKASGGYVRNRDIQTVEGYIQSLGKHGFTGFEEGKDLVKFLRSEDPSKIVDIIRSNEDASFEFVYGQAELKGRLETLLEVFSRPESKGE